MSVALLAFAAAYGTDSAIAGGVRSSELITEEEASTGRRIAGGELLDWARSDRMVELRQVVGRPPTCPAGVSAVIQGALLGPTATGMDSEGASAVGWLETCQKDTGVGVVQTDGAEWRPMERRQTEQVCSAAACTAWMVAVARAGLPECNYRARFSPRSVAETLLQVCDDLNTSLVRDEANSRTASSGYTTQAPDAATLLEMYKLNQFLNLAADATSSSSSKAARSTEVSVLVASTSRRLDEVSSLVLGESRSDGSSTASGHGSGSSEGTLAGFEASSSTARSSAAELAMSYLYICLILALFNCSYLFFMRKT